MRTINNNVKLHHHPPADFLFISFDKFVQFLLWKSTKLVSGFRNDDWDSTFCGIYYIVPSSLQIRLDRDDIEERK